MGPSTFKSMPIGADTSMVKMHVTRIAAIALTWAVVLTLAPAAPSEAAEIPAAGGVHAGFYTDRFYAEGDLDGVAAAAGKRVTFGGTFHTVFENDNVSTPGWSNTKEILESVWQGKSTPFANVIVGSTSASSIAGGAYDAKIASWVSHVKKFLDLGGSRSLIVSPLQEMNGNWTSYGCNPTKFKAAYLKFHNAVRNAGLDETKVRFSFSPNGWTSPGCGKIADYYPGDAYVDIIGISAYNFGTCVGSGWQSVDAVFGPWLNELRTTVNPLKPYVIAQTAAPRSGCGGNQDAWSRDMFAYLAADPNVVGFVWFNHVKETNWKVWQSSTLTQGWKDGMASGSTVYQWPLSSWFTPGALTIGIPDGPGDAVVIVGGSAAVSTSVEWQILGDIGGMPDRIQGTSRYATAAEMSRRYFSPGVDAAFVATGLGFADALSLGAAAGFEGGPLLLVDQNAITGPTATELARLRPKVIYVAGGSSVVSNAVVQSLKAYATTGAVVRLAGANRYATGAEISRSFFDSNVDTVFVATGVNFPDALSAGAAAAAEQSPVLLNPSDALHAQVRAEIIRLGPSKVVLVGGAAALGSAVETAIRALGVTVDRWAGPNRYATSVIVSRSSNDPVAPKLFLATGESFPDALAAVAAAGSLGVPLLLTQPGSIPPNVMSEIRRLL